MKKGRPVCSGNGQKTETTNVQNNSTTRNGSAAIARNYIARGWATIPIPPKSKAPTIAGWEQLRIGDADVPKYFAANSNVGVLNGGPSDGLVDIDLDHPLARELADEFLPVTDAEFGRASSRRSHRLYRVTSAVDTLQRRLPKVDGRAPMIVELRSTGSQTVFPGSVHPEGEKVEWDLDGEPARVAPGLLIAAVNALADEVESRLGFTRNVAAGNGHPIELPADVGERARKYLAKVPPAVSGAGGHDQTFHAACVLVQGFALDRGPALALLGEWNQSCQPPWSDAELEHKIEDALNQPGERGYLLHGDAGIPDGETLGDATTTSDTSKDDGEKKDRKSQATMLVELAGECDLFHDSDGEAFARFPVGNGDTFHWEVSKVRARGFRRWLSRRFYKVTEKTPSAQSLQDALGVIEAKAIYDGDERHVYVRVAEHEGSIYVDLGNDRWQAIEIDRHGWRIVNDPPVVFRRGKAMMALPTPQAGSVGAFRRFANVTDDDWPLLMGFMVGTMRPIGPYPVLGVYGEHGSAKSTLCRYLRRIIDPNVSPLRADYREPRDLMICANGGWIVALDNLSTIKPWLSDCLCRLSTGGGFSTRTLYENDEETIFDAKRPVILNCIEEVVTRSDLLDRCVLLNLPRIDTSQRVPEAQLDQEFGEALPGILGGLLTAVSAAMRNESSVKLSELPRLADFAIWATAAEPALGLKPGEFIDAYTANRSAGNETAIEASPVGKVVFEFVEFVGAWSGTATELLKELEHRVDDKTKKLESWPSTARTLGAAIKRLAPNLREAGLGVELGNRTGRKGTRIIALTHQPERGGNPSSASSATSAVQDSPDSIDLNADANADAKPAADANGICPSSAENGLFPEENGHADATDNADAKKPVCSNDLETIEI
jgi:hypothetical protein